MSESNVAVLPKKGAPVKVVKKRSLTVLQRERICKKIPQSDWDRFAGNEFIAVSVNGSRILDADNDLPHLLTRVAHEYPGEQFFTFDSEENKKRSSLVSR